MTTDAFTPIMSDEKITAHLIRCGFTKFTVEDGHVITKSYAAAVRISRALIGYGVIITVRK